MTHYAVGDLQGCLTPLQNLLERVDFQPGRDTLWSTGDLVNRGPQSLETLRFCYHLGDSFRMVLGNHDLHLLATARGHRAPHRKDTFQAILEAPDRSTLLGWLQQQPLLFSEDGFTVVHAGIPPQWRLPQAHQHAAEVAAVLRGPDADRFFANMYGDEPNQWSDHYRGPARWRLITNYFTRMRFCDAHGRLDLINKQGPEAAPPGMAPWFRFRNCVTEKEQIIFGHWAALNGRECGPGLYPLDTGCVWGGRLRLMRLDTRAFFHCNCQQSQAVLATTVEPVSQPTIL